MPLIEDRATAATACISTAAVYERRDGARDGAPKRHETSWWALSYHHATGYATSTRLLNVVWIVWLIALVATAAIPHTVPMVLSIVLLCLVMRAIPDDGESVCPYCVCLIIPIIVFRTAMRGGAWPYFGFVFVFVIAPVLDYVIGVDQGNQTRQTQKEVASSTKFKVLTLLVAPGVLASLVYGCWIVRDLTTAHEFVGVSLSVGLITGAIGIVAGHELCHKATSIERMAGRFLLCAVAYGHFYIEHTMGHHKHVATDADPATARYGESFHAFLPRVVIGEWRSAWHIERERLRKKELDWWCNEILLYYACSAAICSTLMSAFGRAALPYFLLQSFMATLQFESVNYLEHYGLERREISPGVFEAVAPQHSWDSTARLTNAILFKLQRHADHHAHAGKRYQVLQAYDTSPQLPGGYATMIVLALIPPAWRAVMHPRLMEWRKAQTGQIFRHGPTPVACSDSDPKRK